MSERIGPGYAIRRKYSCNDGEESDDAWARYHYKVCCPGGHGLTFGKDNGDGNTFCENKKLSSDKIDNVCANGTWNLWFADAYFCCEPGLTGYISRTPDNNVKEAAFGCDTKSFIHSGLKGVISEAELSNPKSMPSSDFFPFSLSTFEYLLLLNPDKLTVYRSTFRFQPRSE